MADKILDPYPNYTKALQQSIDITNNKQPTNILVIYNFLKLISHYGNTKYNLNDIIDFVYNIWLSTGHIIVNKDIANLVGNSSKYPSRYTFVQHTIYEVNIGNILIRSYDDYSTELPQDDPLYYPQFSKILIDTLHYNNNCYNSCIHRSSLLQTHLQCTRYGYKKKEYLLCSINIR